MNRRQILLSSLALSAVSATSLPLLAAPNQKRPMPPIPKKIPKSFDQVGRKRVDNYAWMKDDNWQEVMRDPSLLKPEIRGYLEAENAYTKARLEDPTTALRDELFNEMRGRIK
ncbi:MAG TPA: S9 family peptidase, partial [Alphaproteobacteria bacterium]|nr:S9 family peptidase [Alphaproteobacteria bacterium]